MKALDVLKAQREQVQSVAGTWYTWAAESEKDGSAEPGPEKCRAVAEEWAVKAAALERIAKVVEAAQAWLTEEFGTVRQAEVEFDKGYLTGKGLELVQLVAALDAEEGQAAATQEEGEHQP